MEEGTKLRKVAIADDSPAFLAAAANYIATIPGFMLAGIASTPPQTLALVESAAPDVLLLDLGMAPKRGLELVRQVKASPAAPAVVALALFETPEALAAAKRAGADELVGKESFISGLAQVLGRLFPAVS
ncbi:MAG: response regulator transcription factor [Betaproteobacteria bacterium]|nr:MAG: response regulator transcription factor [Betaproteobacteria bacterium]TMH46513.1 MAG: response regulator transcription factor [Betaproteobacteria bacterium]